MSESPPHLERMQSSYGNEDVEDEEFEELVEDWSSFAKHSAHSSNGHNGHASSSSRGTGTPRGERSFPVARMKTILSSGPGGDDHPPNAEAVVAASKATELFVTKLIQDVFRTADTTQIGYDELSASIRHNDELSFLHDFFPKRMRAIDAAKLIQKREKNEKSAS